MMSIEQNPTKIQDSNLKFNLTNLTNNDGDENESIYVLPKTYNGKTVTDLFPEFKYDSVLRFSKLFGVGRVTSLPKIWKGTRKRRKTTKNDLDLDKSQLDDDKAIKNKDNLKSLNINKHEQADVRGDNDVFDLFDQEFSTNKDEDKQNKEIKLIDENKIELKQQQEQKEEEKVEDKKKEEEEIKEVIEEKKDDELEFETDDEIRFMKPYIINDLVNGKNGQNIGGKGKENQTNENLSEFDLNQNQLEYGPASYWYQLYDLNEMIDAKRKEIEKKLKKLEKKKKKKKEVKENESEEEEEEDEEEDEENMKKSKNEEEIENLNEEKLNLSKAIDEINDKIKNEKLLLVNTLNWEDKIIIDLNEANERTNDDSQEIHNERVKFAGWVASSEHRTLCSFQSKVLGKKVDFINQFKDQSVPTQTQFSKQQQLQQQQQQQQSNQAIWNSIFPNENYELLNDEWEKKILIDVDNLEIDELKPIEFTMDLNDDNLLIGIPDDQLIQENMQKDATNDLQSELNKQEQNQQQLQSNQQQHQKRGDKLKMLESRSKSSKGLVLGKTKEENAETNGENNENNENQTSTVNQNEAKSFWNISNDEYYSAKTQVESNIVSKNVSTALVLQHTQAAMQLHPQFFPTHLSFQKLRNFHRLPLKRFINSSVLINESSTFNQINSLLKNYFKKKPTLQFPTSFSTTSNSQTLSSSLSSSDFLSIRNANDLTASDNCQLILAEYSEQYPPLMMQAGMATKIRNYYKKKFSKDEGPQNFEFGELVYTSSSPFLGVLKPGEALQAIENLMFRAPIYKHKLAEQDFLLVRSKTNGYLIRSDIKSLFVVGQQCPLIEVPGPNSKRANSFIKDFLQAYIVRLFHESNEVPKRIKMEDVKKAFPTYPENSIRKRLKLCADFIRNGKSDTNWWILREDVRLPTEEEIRGLVTPEQCCAYYSMLAAEQRLKDAGYGEKNLFASDDDDVDNSKIDDEVKNAPWHTTRAYLDAIKGKCLLQINGVADPTGRGEGFSYVRQPIKDKKENDDANNSKCNEDTKLNDSVSSPATATSSTTATATTAAAAAVAAAQQQAKRTVTGTDADLRRLHLSQAKELLASYGVPDHEIKKLKRWEIIDVVRTMSTQKAKEGNGSAVSKFARGNRATQSDAHEKFKEECQRLFELQNRNLASEEFFSTDDDEELDEDSDVDEMGKNLESMLSNKMQNNHQTSNTSTTNNSKTLNSNNNNNNNPNNNESEIKNIIMDQNKSEAHKQEVQPENPNMQRVLKITRTYRDEETGQEYTKTEIVNKALVIDAYVKIRTTRDEEFIRSLFTLDEEEKEQLRKERRRLQEQLRRVKRNEAKQANGENNNNNSTGEVQKVRKYNKTGLNKKSNKLPKSAKFINESTQMASENTNQSLMSSPEAKKFNMNKLSLHYSSGDEDKSQDRGELMLNNSRNLNQSNSQQPQKRKYVKRKKPAEADANSLMTPGLGSEAAGAAGLTKVEGTKLIIQKKAIKLALNSEGDNTETGSPVKKKYRTKKMKLLEASMNNSLNSSSITANNNTSELMVVDTSTNDAVNDNSLDGQKLAPKIKIVNKSSIEQKASIVLTIPKEKLALSANNNNSSNINDMSLNNSTNTSGNNSPSVVDVTSLNDSHINSNTNTPQQQAQKRQYNKQQSLIKKQQKMLIQQQQEQQQQLQLQQQLQQLSQAQLDPNAAAALVATQFANFFEPQQLLMALSQQQQLQQILQSPNIFQQQNPFSTNTNTPTTPVNSKQSGQQQQQQQQQQSMQKRKISTQNSQCDYLVKPHKKVDRRHADPAVSLAIILEGFLNEMRDLPEAQAFLLPVNSKKVPDYYKLIKNPIDLQKIRKKCNDKIYKNRQSFLDDIKLLIDNSLLYNGRNHIITLSAEKLYDLCVQRCDEKNDQLTRLEKAINPLLDENSLIVFNYLLDQIYEQYIITVENSFSFLKPVNKAKYKDYYEIIKQPIDLETIKQKITSKKYKSREEFVNDFELLYSNCVTYNGLNNSYTDTAQKLFDTCKLALDLDEYRDQLQSLEDEIQLALNKQSNHDENSSGLGNFGTRNSSLISVDSYTDNESNFNVDNSGDIPIMTTNQTSNSNQMSLGLVSTKKVKPMSSKAMKTPVLNNPNSNINILKPVGSSANLQSSKKKRNLLSMGEIVRNSPKSGSDAEVFVDVESIDDRNIISNSNLTSQNDYVYDEDNDNNDHF